MILKNEKNQELNNKINDLIELVEKLDENNDINLSENTKKINEVINKSEGKPTMIYENKIITFDKGLSLSIKISNSTDRRAYYLLTFLFIKRTRATIS